MEGRAMGITPRSWIGTKEAAAMMGVSRDWLLNNFRRSGWPPHYRVGPHVRFDRAKFEAFIEARNVTPGEDKAA